MIASRSNDLEHKYIEPLLNENTGLIEDNLPTALTYLDTNYDRVPSEEIKQKESEGLAMSFNPADPMVVLYRPIKQLQKLATAAGIPYSSAYQLKLGLTLIWSTRYFKKALGEWNKKMSTTKTWATFKTHFKEA